MPRSDAALSSVSALLDPAAIMRPAQYPSRILPRAPGAAARNVVRCVFRAAALLPLVLSACSSAQAAHPPAPQVVVVTATSAPMPPTATRVPPSPVPTVPPTEEPAAAEPCIDSQGRERPAGHWMCRAIAGSVPTPIPTATAHVPAALTIRDSAPTAVCRFASGRGVYNALREYKREWDDGVAVAGSTARIALAPQIARLQSIRRDVEREPWPTCTGQAATYMVRAMNLTIDGYVMFQSVQWGPILEGESRRKLAEADSNMKVAIQQVNGVAH
jgi:hypothetical protein